MKIYLAGSISNESFKILENKHNKYLLQTFYDLRKMKDDKIEKLLNCCDEFLLDSGAFTFMNSGKKVDWKQYIDDYCDFVNKWDIKQFIELDLDHVVGVEDTIRIRKYIEQRTGKKPIPVFHRIRGMKYFREMCQEYPYIAIAASGIVKGIDEYVKNADLLKQLLRIAHSYGTKVHGLAYTRLANINNITVPFDSVDSTAWLSGARFGTIYEIRNGQIKQRKSKRRMSESEINKINLDVWLKIQEERSREDVIWIK